MESARRTAYRARCPMNSEPENGGVDAGLSSRPDFIEPIGKRLRPLGLVDSDHRAWLLEVKSVQVMAVVDDHQWVGGNLGFGTRLIDGHRVAVRAQQVQHARARALQLMEVVDDDVEAASAHAAQKST